MRRTIWIVCICVVLLIAIAAAVYLIPQSKEMDLTFTGVQIASDGSVIGECVIDLKAIRNDYLLKNDSYNSIKISVPGYQLNTSNNRGNIIYIMTAPDLPVEYMSFLSYIEPHMCPIGVFLDLEQKWCAVTVTPPSGEDVCFIGTADPDTDPMDIWKEWHFMFD